MPSPSVPSISPEQRLVAINYKIVKNSPEFSSADVPFLRDGLKQLVAEGYLLNARFLKVPSKELD